jgi:septation ring formation regulator EzrA
MNNREKLEKMDRALRLLEDLKNSQVALIEKSSQLQMDAMSFNFPEMEKNMADLYSRYSESLEMLDQELDRFQSKRDKFEKDNKLDQPEL